MNFPYKVLQRRSYFETRSYSHFELGGPVGELGSHVLSLRLFEILEMQLDHLIMQVTRQEGIRPIILPAIILSTSFQNS